MAKKIAVIVGSLRKESFNRKMAHNLIKLAPASLSLEILEISDLAMYNQDLEENPPQAWLDFRARVRSYDGIVFVTPEYNRSVPAVLKNAIDVGSRPPAQNAWNGKPGAVISVSPGAFGGISANHHLRQSLMCIGIATMPTPEAYIGGASKIFDEKGDISVDSTREFVAKFINAFADWVE